MKIIQDVGIMLSTHLQTQTQAAGQIPGPQWNHQSRIQSTRHWTVREWAVGHLCHSTCSSVETMDVVHSE